MEAQSGRSKMGSRKILVAIWVLAAIAGVALFEWDMTPRSGRHKAGGLSAGPGPVRYLVMREWRRNTDYTFVPSAERMRHPEGGLHEIYQLATDKDGFIEPARRHQQPDLSIVFLGGSTTECMYVAPDNRFPHLAARKLEQALGLKVNGINAALSGNNSMHSLLLLLGKVVPLRPDFVVLMHGINDIGALTTERTYWSTSGSLRLFEEERISVGDAGKVLVRSVIPYTTEQLQRGTKALRELFRVRRAQAQTPKPAEAPDRRAEMGRDFESSLRSFVRVATAWGITPVLMTQVYVEPTSATERSGAFVNREQLAGAGLRPDEHPTLLDYFNAITREVARSEATPLIDLARARSWRFGDVYDAVHFTDEGSKQVAEIVAAALKEQIGLKRKAPEGGARTP
jgi:lysophospholipase L1-like esterase